MTLDAAHAWLTSNRSADGTWGYLPGQPGRAEPTLLAGAAGQPVPIAWLGATDLGFAQLLLPAALAEVAGAQELSRQAIEAILATKGESSVPPPGIFSHNATLVGWNWFPGTASWVEPTAYALLSLCRTGHEGNPRVREGWALLADRQCDDGGWNYGNPSVFDQRLSSFPGPTAWAVMALPAGPTANRGLERLLALRAEPSSQSLALSVLARVAHDAPLEGLDAQLADRQRPDGSFNGRVDTTALAALALRAAEEGTHVFDLTP